MPPFYGAMFDWPSLRRCCRTKLLQRSALPRQLSGRAAKRHRPACAAGAVDSVSKYRLPDAIRAQLAPRFNSAA
ncbi:hypothetical protein [Xanthomonas sp. NCPPB 1128]|uniref:hypothetical protein n=1 Tax=Xanthomonas sp. NCPPB 1128 TaxID=1775876 RepID=UPI00103DA650|nr:hypothetical protein [Xanthomonas sp. NCPPB 1128]